VGVKASIHQVFEKYHKTVDQNIPKMETKIQGNSNINLSSY